MPTYNKLVRNLIPQIIEKQGKALETQILSDEEYHKELRTKLQEEVNEYLEAESDVDAVEELADVLELMKALAKQHGSSIEEVEKVREEKAEKRGAFDEKVFLRHVED
ncbi:Predicted house-cleaning noncanonical NTP pyrophosphatase, all-alpha NTP-PPase (MazG) superfamily [Halobacillus karajensis]|uniref:nucleoside triphosphate pyrophosphohydrolase n=1 Tax=Halobacillus karajensis TaxID=195088 RepID=UPI0008A7B38C|nr:nucleoside triphosphate pyrophosphohydrolase [Halobacillus karajensis]SEH83584.1 Predicted house-cleaning noncanonical NTP pyrophosphatase, all-alpha NTP-PPase (MazG) superfamily [Halobacillus karajensis]